MCSCSGGVMLSQNWRAWLKWSSYDAGASRVFTDSATRAGTSMNAPSRGPPAKNGQPPSSEFGLYGATPPWTASWWKPSRSMSLTGACGRLIGIWVKFGPPEPGQLGVDVGEQPRLQQRVVGDVDAGHQVADVEGDLLGLGEVVGRVVGQREQPDRLHRGELLGHELGRVEQVDALEHLLRRCRGRPARRAPTAGSAPASIASARSRRWKSGSVPASICASSQVSEWTPRTGFQWNLTRDVSPAAFDAPEGVDAEALHGPVGARDAAVGHVPDRVVLGLGVQRDEVPERVVGALRLRDLPVRVRLAGVDHVGELDAVLDEEDRDVVADQVEGALVGVELRGEPAGVAHGVRRAARPEDGREPHEHRRLDLLGQEPGRGHRAARCRSRRTSPWAPAPRAWTTRSGIRSWSKCVIFSRRWWSCSSVGPRSPALSEWSESRSRAPWAVVSQRPWPDTASASTSVGAPVAVRRSGPAWSGFGGSGSRGLVGSATVGRAGAGSARDVGRRHARPHAPPRSPPRSPRSP